MTALELKTYEIFKSKLGEEEAGTVLQFIDEKAQEKVSAQKDAVASKDDFRKLEREDSRLEQTLKAETSRLENRVGAEAARLESLIKSETARIETVIERGLKEQLKWLIVLLFGFASLIITVIKLL
ncbi:hypothetical protein [Spirosoma sp. KUDC1026]|uniref:hypothetical protein n=1 Tax=Spirosoma sp. KUDC1026 TaxID=2745947 RepID=UPI00159B91DC|nr:hypothetical protein [Spirosoma sp. KUDC1026]QKZ15289.1 hypothetical protein HU175_22755 [Spirosoma sp. KUDC1026]